MSEDPPSAADIEALFQLITRQKPKVSATNASFQHLLASIDPAQVIYNGHTLLYWYISELDDVSWDPVLEALLKRSSPTALLKLKVQHASGDITLKTFAEQQGKDGFVASIEEYEVRALAYIVRYATRSKAQVWLDNTYYQALFNKPIGCIAYRTTLIHVILQLEEGSASSFAQSLRVAIHHGLNTKMMKNVSGRYGTTPLHTLVRSQQETEVWLEILRVLLEYADLNQLSQKEIGFFRYTPRGLASSLEKTQFSTVLNEAEQRLRRGGHELAVLKAKED